MNINEGISVMTVGYSFRSD